MNIYEQNTIKVQYYNLSRNYELSEVIASKILIFNVTSNYFSHNILVIYSYCNSKMVNSFKIKMVNIHGQNPIKEQ